MTSAVCTVNFVSYRPYLFVVKHTVRLSLDYELTKDKTDLQEMLIAEPGGHEGYTDRHAMRTRECRYVDDRHVKSLR